MYNHKMRAWNKQTGEEVIFTEIEYLSILGKYYTFLWNQPTDNYSESSRYNKLAIKHILKLKGLDASEYIVGECKKENDAVDVIPTEILGERSRVVTQLDNVMFLISNEEYAKLRELVISDAKKQARVYFDSLIRKPSIEIENENTFAIENNFKEVFNNIRQF